MGFWQKEYEREKQAHRQTSAELANAHDLIDVQKAFIAFKRQERRFLEFLLAERLGETRATEIINGTKQSRKDTQKRIKEDQEFKADRRFRGRTRLKFIVSAKGWVMAEKNGLPITISEQEWRRLPSLAR